MPPRPSCHREIDKGCTRECSAARSRTRARHSRERGDPRVQEPCAVEQF
ncbi:hypothetical protein SFR_4069 [Streptomyces sp. FR-008]|nr:hypothetical protein SFR_4069 [Streptomyces sp. FR-008]